MAGKIEKKEVKTDKKKEDKKPAYVAPVIKKFKTEGRENKEFKGIIRLVGKDINGHYEVKDALRLIRGIGQNISRSLALVAEKNLNISRNELIGNLTEEKLAELEKLLKNPREFKIRLHLLNRPRDVESGKEAHFLATDLVFSTKQDIQRERDSRSYVGWRHSLGQRVRGQRNRSTGRSGMTVGVLKKALKAGKGAAPAKEDKK
ncbi:30S ribosomal protein S13 [Candidatus Micrarchaeota archaeon]|nr:30S ribosomal protein S13 [Candidatus Micrarchaeota archaeon]